MEIQYEIVRYIRRIQTTVKLEMLREQLLATEAKFVKIYFFSMHQS